MDEVDGADLLGTGKQDARKLFVSLVAVRRTLVANLEQLKSCRVTRACQMKGHSTDHTRSIDGMG